MVKLRKNSAYQNLERPYTRFSKFNKKNFIRGGIPALKISRFEMGDPRKKFEMLLRLNSLRNTNIRHNSLESARMTSNRVLEKGVGNNFHLKLKVYPFHVLRENAMAAGAGADRMSQGMSQSYGKPVGVAARVVEGQTLLELKIDTENVAVGREALHRAAKKLPCGCKVVTMAA